MDIMEAYLLMKKSSQTIHTEIKRGIVLQMCWKRALQKVYSADYAQQAYESNRKCSVKKSLDQGTKGKRFSTIIIKIFLLK